jgi:hypothetical protein
MYQPKRLVPWALVLLAAGLCWTEGSASAQNPTPNSNSTPNTPPPVKMLTNPSLQRRQLAMDQLTTAVNARTQTDPQYKKYIDSVDRYNSAMNKFVKDKGGAR